MFALSLSQPPSHRHDRHRRSHHVELLVVIRHGLTHSYLLRPIPLLRISLLRLLDSSFLGNPPMDMRIPPLKNKICLNKTPLKSRISVRRLAVSCFPV